MRALLLMISVPVLGLAGMAAATPVDAARQCPAAWSAEASPMQCRVGAAKVCPADYSAEPDQHLMTRAEVRAELDSIRLDRTSQDTGSQMALADRTQP